MSLPHGEFIPFTSSQTFSKHRSVFFGHSYPLFSSTLTCLAALLYILATHWDLKHPAGLTEQSVIVAAGNKGPLWHLLSQAASCLRASFLPWDGADLGSSARMRRKEQHRAKRRHRRGRWRLQIHPSIHLFSHHPPTRKQLAVCPKAYPKSSWDSFVI